MIDWFRYLVIFLVGGLSDILTNKLVTTMSNPTGALSGLKFYYNTISWYQSAFWAGLIFVVIYIISDWVYKKLRPWI